MYNYVSFCIFLIGFKAFSRAQHCKSNFDRFKSIREKKRFKSSYVDTGEHLDGVRVYSSLKINGNRLGQTFRMKSVLDLSVYFPREGADAGI